MTFVAVGKAADIAVGRGAYVDTGGAALAVFNAGGGRFFACAPTCPHEDGPLADGWVEGDTVVCPWHGFDFDLKTGECLAEQGLSVPVYRVRVVGGMLEVDLP
jgi:nitrite reductase/ring-hydroxylating ferredoxin subunit